MYMYVNLCGRAVHGHTQSSPTLETCMPTTTAAQQGRRAAAGVRGSPWQMELSEVPLMWKPASQLQCWAWSTLAQRGRLLKAGSFTTLHSGGAALTARRGNKEELGLDWGRTGPDMRKYVVKRTKTLCTFKTLKSL